jgi:hypothetical protein
MDSYSTWLNNLSFSSTFGTFKIIQLILNDRGYSIEPALWRAGGDGWQLLP